LDWQRAEKKEEIFNVHLLIKKPASWFEVDFGLSVNLLFYLRFSDKPKPTSREAFDPDPAQVLACACCIKIIPNFYLKFNKPSLFVNAAQALC